MLFPNPFFIVQNVSLGGKQSISHITGLELQLQDLEQWFPLFLQWTQAHLLQFFNYKKILCLAGLLFWGNTMEDPPAEGLI